MSLTRTVVVGLFLASTSLVVYGGHSEPTFADVAYGKHERNKLDFWQAKSDEPTPLIVFFHGGGFKMGDKSNIRHILAMEDCLAQGVSVAAVNYPFLQHTNNDYIEIMKNGERAVQFLKGNAREWNIDVKRVAAAGSSAGAILSEWLGGNTRDISVLGIYFQPYGAEFWILRKMNKRFPPTFIYQVSGPGDEVHHPRFAQKLKDACDAKGVTCELWGSRKSGLPQLPDGKKPLSAMLEFFARQWDSKKEGRREGPAGRVPLASKRTTKMIQSDETREIRTWTASAGTSIRARLISETAGYIVLGKEDGKKLKILSSKLSQEDQEYIQSLK
jgi:predicted esterase